MNQRSNIAEGQVNGETRLRMLARGCKRGIAKDSKLSQLPFLAKSVKKTKCLGRVATSDEASSLAIQDHELKPAQLMKRSKLNQGESWLTTIGTRREFVGLF